MCVDSDDILTANAVERILETAGSQSGINGIISYKTDLEGKRLSGEFPPGIERTKLYELETVYGCSGEYAIAFPTEFARRFPFPVFPGERFVGESVVYDRMDREGQMYLLGEVTMPCEYQPDGYSQAYTRLMGAAPTGFCLYFLQRIDLSQSIKSRILTSGRYWCFRLMCRNRELRYQGKHQFVVRMSAPLGLLFRIYYRMVRGF